MDIEKTRNREAQRNIQDLLESAEQRRVEQRVVHGYNGLLGGNLTVLENDELVGKLPSYITLIMHEQPVETSIQLLRQLGKGVAAGKTKQRERAVTLFSILVKHLLGNQSEQALPVSAELLADWIDTEREFTAGYAVMCTHIEKTANMLLARGVWAEVEHLLERLYTVHRGSKLKNRSVQTLLYRTLANIASNTVLQEVYDNYLQSTDPQERETLQRIAVYLGENSIRYCLKLQEDGVADTSRELLVKILSASRSITSDAIISRLQEQVPWSVVVDMIHIISLIRDDSLYHIIASNLSHTDLRVQREAVRAIIKLGGESMLERLTAALPVVDDSQKILIIKRLAVSGSPHVGTALQELLENKINRNEIHEESLISALAVSMQRFPEKKCLILLQRIQLKRAHLRTRTSLDYLVEESIRSLETQLRHIKHRRVDSDTISYDEDPAVVQKARAVLRDVEQQVRSAVKAGNVSQAVKLLQDSAIGHAREKNYTAAEILRDRILEIDPTAVGQLLETDEVINEEKQSLIPASAVKVWATLHERITWPVFEALFEYGFIEEYSEGETIVREGDYDPSLYLVNSGTVSLSCSTGYSTVFLQRMRAGNILGFDSLFSISMWTISVKATTAVEVLVLSKETIQRLDREFHDVGHKLRRYCQQADPVCDLVRLSGEDRRVSIRHKVAANAHTKLLDRFGIERRRVIRCQLHDISSGGYCCSIRVENHDNTRLLLGRHVKTEVRDDNGAYFSLKGRIVGVEPIRSSEQGVKVHVRLHQTLSRDNLNATIKSLQDSMI